MDTAFFILAKIVGFLMQSGTWIAIGLVLALWGMWRQNSRFARRTILVTLALYLFLGFVPVGSLLIAPLEKQFPIAPDLTDIDGIIVLGGGERGMRSAVWNQPQFAEAGERQVIGAVLARQHPSAVLIFAGGSGRLQDVGGIPVPESQVASHLWQDLGIGQDRIIVESQSRNTAENASLSYRVVQPQPGTRWVLVTSASHMPRAHRSFVRAGWPAPIAYPVDYQSGTFWHDIRWDPEENMRVLDTALREYVGLLIYGVTGR